MEPVLSAFYPPPSVCVIRLLKENSRQGFRTAGSTLHRGLNAGNYLIAVGDTNSLVRNPRLESLKAQQQVTTTITVHAGGHWRNRLGHWFGGTSLAIGFARFGRLGGPAHRAAIGRISRLLEESGYSVSQEKYIPTPNGAKGYRFADVYGKNDSTGEVRMYQVGRTNANGTPVSREVQAMDDIEGSTGIRPQFIDYNSPLATGEMPVMPMGDMPEPEIPEIPIDIP